MISQTGRCVARTAAVKDYFIHGAGRDMSTVVKEYSQQRRVTNRESVIKELPVYHGSALVAEGGFWLLLPDHIPAKTCTPVP